MSVMASRLVLSVGKGDEPCEIAFCCTLPLFVQFRTRSTIQNKDGTRQHNVLGFLSRIKPSPALVSTGPLHDACVGAACRIVGQSFPSFPSISQGWTPL